MSNASVAWTGDNTLQLTEASRTDPGPLEIQVAVESCGICGSDLHFFRGDWPVAAGLTPGHEFGGQVSAVGTGVSHVKEGDLVGIEPIVRCNVCRFCTTGNYHICEDQRLIGGGTDGGMRQFATVPANTAFVAPAGMNAELTALPEPLACNDCKMLLSLNLSN